MTGNHFIHGDTVGLKVTPEWQAWKGMISRCTNPTNKSYPRYGARGIRVCERWLGSYSAFLEDVGRKPSPSHMLGRRDNDGDYEPGNCRWETRVEQCRNTSRTIWVEANDQRMSLSEACEKLGLNYHRVRGRVSRGTDPQKALY